MSVRLSDLRLAETAEATDRVAKFVRLADRAEARHPELTSRIRSGLLLAVSGDVLPHPSRPEARLVRSQRNPTFCQLVDTYASTCICPDYAWRTQHGYRPFCKHLIAVLLAEPPVSKEDRQPQPDLRPAA